VIQKSVLFFLIGIILMTACKVAIVEKAQDVILLQDNPGLYNNTGYWKASAGDTLHSESYGYLTHWGTYPYKSSKPTLFYNIIYNNKEYQVDAEYVIPVSHYKYYSFEMPVRIPNEQEEQAWSLVMNYIQEHSDMRIDKQFDILIETYKPTSFESKGYVVNKIKNRTDVEIVIKVMQYNQRCSECLEARKFAYYLLNELNVE